MNIFIIGNGESRQGFDLNELRGKGTIFGCNALYRNFEPDYLVVLDKPMLQEVKQNANTSNIISLGTSKPTRDRKKRQTEARLNDKHLIYLDMECIANSGMLAVLAAATISEYTNIYLIGFDLHNNHSNLYKGTENYKHTYDHICTDAYMDFYVEKWNKLQKQIAPKTLIRIGDVDQYYIDNNIPTLTYSEFKTKLKIN